MNEQLATTQAQLSAPDFLAVIARAAQDPNCDVDKMERLLGMAERMQAKAAEMEFASAFVKVQEELPEIVAKTEIPKRGKYERFEDVMHVARPIYTKNGFSVSFSQEADDKRVKAICHVQHSAGHSKDTPFSVRLSKAADSETQADCKASTTAKRNAFLMAFNIVIRQDCMQDEDDARNEGGAITQEQADGLRDWFDAVGGDLTKFLEMAGKDVKRFEDIPSSMLPVMQDALRRKEMATKRL